MRLIDEPSRREIEAASRLWHEAESWRVRSPPYESYLEDQRRGFIDTMSRHEAWLTLAARQSVVVGLVGGIRPTADRPAAHLGYIAVDPAHRRTGIGRILMQHARARGHEMGASTMLLTVHEANAAAQQLYEQAGWRRTGRTESTPFDDEPLIEYSIDVAGS